MARLRGETEGMRAMTQNAFDLTGKGGPGHRRQFGDRAGDGRRAGGGGRRRRGLGPRRGQDRGGGREAGRARPAGGGAGLRRGRRSRGRGGLRRRPRPSRPHRRVLRQRRRLGARGVVPRHDGGRMAARARDQSRRRLLHPARGGAAHGRARRRRLARRHRQPRGDRGAGRGASITPRPRAG